MISKLIKIWKAKRKKEQPFTLTKGTQLIRYSGINLIRNVKNLYDKIDQPLLKGIKRDVKLILVGDYYQLPSVNQGQVLKDLIDSEVIDIIKLNCLYRQNENSYIPVLASEIKEKDLSQNVCL